MNEPRNDGLTCDMLPEWYEAATAALSFPLGWKESITEPVIWKQRGRKAFRSLLLENRESLDPAMELIRGEDRGGYRVDLIDLNLGRFRRSRAFIAVPAGPGPFPAAILLHDHGAFFDIGKEKMIRPFTGDPKTAAAVEWAAGNYGGRFIGDDLAAAGWAVLATDALGWGDRICGGYDSQQAVASNLLNLGSSWAGLIAVEDLAAAAFMAKLPFVDPRRLACVGHSMGGWRSWQLAALSDQITAGIAVCAIGTVRGLMRPGGNRTRGQSAFSMTHPGLTRLMDFPDVAALAAPKPLLMIHGSNDHLYETDDVRTAYGNIAAVYRAFHAEAAFRGEIRSGGHAFTADDQSLAWAWLNEVLTK